MRWSEMVLVCASTYRYNGLLDECTVGGGVNLITGPYLKERLARLCSAELSLIYALILLAAEMPENLFLLQSLPDVQMEV